jgi:3',5'-cyclic-nucleotide phosphodiesterase
VAKIRELDAAVTDACKPTLVILHVYTDLDIQAQPKRREQLSRSSASPIANRDLTASPDLEDLYSIQLLQHISNEIAYSNYSKLILPVAMASNLEGILASDRPTPGGRPTRPASNSFNPLGPDSTNAALDSEVYTRSAPVAPKRMMKCLNAGAVDVITSPLDKARISGLIAHVYRAHKESLKDQAAFLATMRQRKRSWVGMENDVPYAYLRESM